MRTNTNRPALRRVAKHGSQTCWWSSLAACLTTLLALPVNAAFPIPDDPLTTAARIAPNILFILDDSGSMGFVAMPAEVKDSGDPVNWAGARAGLSDNPTDRSYLNNTIYYDPNVKYETWARADGTRVSGGTAINSVYSHWSLTTGARDLRDSIESVFYVPKSGITNSTNANDFIRYSVRTNNGAAEVVRALPNEIRSGYSTWTNNIDPRAWVYQTIQVPFGTSRLEVSIAGNRADGNAELYLRRGTDNPTTSNNGHDFRDTGSGSSHSIIVNNPAPGSWRVGIYNVANASIFSNRRVEGNVLSVSNYTNVEVATPTGRTQLDELVNIATWYSYHRSRIKAAKAGASEAFGPLGGKVRVGFRTINRQEGSVTTENWPRQDVPIPVNYNDGRFSDESSCVNCDNRTKWYSRLHSATENSGGTPLRTALNDAGLYFSKSDSNGPYGPESGAGQYSCRQNFAILTTDGYWNDEFTGVGNSDGTGSVQDTPIEGPNGQTYRYIASASENSRFRDNYSNTLADVAMHYWRRDLRPGMTNNVPVTSSNPAFWQHMVTFGISIGLSGSKGWSSVAQVPAAPNWSQPVAGQASTIDDLLHAAVNSRGQFVAASNPSQFTAGLGEALAAIIQRTSSFSNVATNSVSLDAGSQVFSASYVSGSWTGTVTARAVSRAGVSDTVTWTATTPAWGSRNIYTSSATVVGVAGGSGASFPTSAQQAALARTGGPANFQVSGEENALYIKGKPGLEARNGGLLRNRTSIIGDIVGSSPAYVKETNTLYVGANDGMLHAFDAKNGLELFAYVPNIVNFAGLSTLSRGDYAHKFLVDGPVVVSERSVTKDQNILVGTLGKGGKGLYALDVTNPASLTRTEASVFLWERNVLSGGATDHMGLILGKPFFARVQGGNAAVVFGNGLNSGSQSAVLVVLDAESGEPIRQIDTQVGSASAPNGLSAATGVFGEDGRTLAYVYAGDMQGNVWKFDLTSETPANWSFKRLFTAGNGTDVQPITSAITVAKHPRTRRTWLFFGTGRYLLADDADANSAASAVVQSMYGFMENEGNTAVLRRELTLRGLTKSTTVMDGYPVRTFDAKASLPDGSKGWYINMPEPGERVVQDAQVVSTLLVTASMVPRGSACEADGSGYINAFDAFTGTSSGGSYFDLDGDGRTDDSVVGGLPVGSINPNVGMPTLPNLLRGRVIVGGTSGEVKGPASLMPRWDRVSWREVRRD